MTAEKETLVRSATEWAAVPFVPEVTLRTAAEPFGLWDRTERDAPPFWAFPWAGGQGLARYVLDHPETVASHQVLDVASGSGLVAIAAAKAGARTVLATDIDENALIAIALNAAANNTPQVIPRSVDLAAASPSVSHQGTVGHNTVGHNTVGHNTVGQDTVGQDTVGQDTVGQDAVGQDAVGQDAVGQDAVGGDPADPGTATADLIAPLAADIFRAPDVVLAADVFYQRDLAAMALAFLKAAQRAGAAVFVADPARAFVPRAELTPVLTYEIPVLKVLEDSQVKTVTIYSLR